MWFTSWRDALHCRGLLVVFQKALNQITANMDHFLISWIICVNLLFRTCLASGPKAYAISDLKAPSAWRLSPATLAASLGRRSDDSNLLKREAVFDFIDAANHNAGNSDDSVFTASVSVKSQMPILVLEDLELDLKHVSCSDSSIEFSFISIERLEHSCKQLEHISTFVVVTSHSGCNTEDHRAPHL